MMPTKRVPHERVRRQELREERRKLCIEVPALKVRLGQAGLWRTMQVMEEVVKEIGWEVAEIDYGQDPRLAERYKREQAKTVKIGRRPGE